MRLYQQLVLFMLAATVLPLAFVGFWVLRTSEDELVHRISEEQKALGVLSARDSAAALMGAVEALGRGTEAIDWAAASPEEAKGGLSLLYQQSDAISAVMLVDSQGKTLAGPVLRTGGDGHPLFSGGEAALLAAVPVGSLRAGDKGQAALGSAYAGPEGAAGRMAVAVKAGPGRDAPFVLAELGLQAVERALGEHARQSLALFELVDGGGRIIASSDPGGRFLQLPSGLWDRIRAAGAQPQLSFSSQTSPRQLVTVVKVPDELGLWAVVSREEAEALAPVARMRRTVLVSIAVAFVILLALGALYTRRLDQRIQRVVHGAEAYGRGELSWRIPVSGGDELADLSYTFNEMGAELETARARLLRWNDELRQKVEEATADLRAAQAQLVEAQKLAAVGQLGAGVAHEINNPLAGILGNTQLLMLDRDEKDPDFEALRKIELSARRCKEITQNLLRFSQQRERPELRPVDLAAVVGEALSLNRHQLEGEGISLKLELGPGGLPVNADPGHVQQVLLALVSNARTAMLKSQNKALTVRACAEGDEAVVTVEDTGKGISREHLPRIFEPFFTTKDIWSNVGLGLSVSYRMISEHRGRIEVRSEPGKGTVVTLRLPLLAAGTGAGTGTGSGTRPAAA